jgi:hypothetical protein
MDDVFSLLSLISLYSFLAPCGSIEGPPRLSPLLIDIALFSSQNINLFFVIFLFFFSFSFDTQKKSLSPPTRCVQRHVLLFLFLFLHHPRMLPLFQPTHIYTYTHIHIYIQFYHNDCLSKSDSNPRSSPRLRFWTLF